MNEDEIITHLLIIFDAVDKRKLPNETKKLIRDFEHERSKKVKQ